MREKILGANVLNQRTEHVIDQERFVFFVFLFFCFLLHIADCVLSFHLGKVPYFYVISGFRPLNSAREPL